MVRGLRGLKRFKKKEKKKKSFCILGYDHILFIHSVIPIISHYEQLYNMVTFIYHAFV